MRLTFRVLNIVPELFRVPLFGFEPGFARLQFKALPVERNRRGVEQRPVKSLVFLVPFRCSELIEVENMRPENELMRNLFDFDVRARLDVRQLNDRVRLAVLLDTFVDGFLNVVVPNLLIGV